jgi:pseudouridine-5'-phosphate glycosidase
VEHLIRVADEVQAALSEERPVVALETTLVAHGFPAPAGIEVGLASEAAVRAAGATPATIGVLDGPDRRRAHRARARAVHTGGAEARAARSGRLRRPARRRRDDRGGTLAVAATVGIRFMGTGGLAACTAASPRRRTSPPTSASARACPP